MALLERLLREIKGEKRSPHPIEGQCSKRIEQKLVGKGDILVFVGSEHLQVQV